MIIAQLPFEMNFITPLWIIALASVGNAVVQYLRYSAECKRWA